MATDSDRWRPMATDGDTEREREVVGVSRWWWSKPAATTHVQMKAYLEPSPDGLWVRRPFRLILPYFWQPCAGGFSLPAQRVLCSTHEQPALLAPLSSPSYRFWRFERRREVACEMAPRHTHMGEVRDFGLDSTSDAAFPSPPPPESGFSTRSHTHIRTLARAHAHAHAQQKRERVASKAPFFNALTLFHLFKPPSSPSLPRLSMNTRAM